MRNQRRERDEDEDETDKNKQTDEGTDYSIFDDDWSYSLQRPQVTRATLRKVPLVKQVKNDYGKRPTEEPPTGPHSPTKKARALELK